MAHLNPVLSVHGEDHLTLRIEPHARGDAAWLSVTVIDGTSRRLLSVNIYDPDERGVTVEDLRPAPLMASMTEAAE